MRKYKYAVEVGSNSTETRTPWIYYNKKEAIKGAKILLKNHSEEGNPWAGVWRLDNDGIMVDRDKQFGYIFMIT